MSNCGQGIFYGCITISLLVIIQTHQSSSVRADDAGGGGTRTEGGERGTVIGDGSPAFIVEPDVNYYVLKSRPATVSCKAMQAVQVSFQCVGRWVQPKHHVNVEQIDPASGVRYLQTSIEVSFADVQDYEGSEGYWCECHAWNSLPNMDQPKETKSRRAVVQIAYIRKQFEREPIGIAVRLDETVQLDCLPPLGVPQPEVFWLRNGVPIDTKQENHFIISSEGNLIISQVSLAFAGNYSCGAQNVAGRRTTEAALLTVFVNGGWSSWSQWSECPAQCKGNKRRYRSCTNPAPVNGGSACDGDNVQRAACICPVNGGWTTWSSWSSCGTDCHHYRQRKCQNPPPANGGLNCEGVDIDRANCSGAMCRADDMNLFAEAVKPSSAKDSDVVRQPSTETSLAVYVGLAVTVSVFIAVLIVVIILLRWKCQPVYTTSMRGPMEKKFGKNQKDITQTYMAIKNSNTSQEKRASVIYPTDGGGPSPVITENMLNTRKSQLLDRMEKVPDSSLLRITGDRLSFKSSECGSRPDSAYIEIPHHLQPESALYPVPPSLDPDTLVCLAYASVTSAGGRLSLLGGGVSLTIPEGALPDDCSETVYLAVCRDDRDRPKLTDSQTLLGPVIVCGPPGIVFQKPVIVSFQHCASLRHGQWRLAVHGCPTVSGDNPIWQPLVLLGQETINTPLYVQVDLDQCHIMLDSLCRLALIGEPYSGGKPVKILRTAVFAPENPPSVDYCLRVYVVENTPDALEGILQVEQKLGGRIVDKPKLILYQHGGGSLCLTLNDLCVGWRCKLNANYQEIPFQHVWSGSQNGLHCSFVLEHLERNQQHLSCSVTLQQRLLAANCQTLQITCNLAEQAVPLSLSHHALSSHHTTPSHHSISQPLLPSVVSSSGYGHIVTTLDSPDTIFRLPLQLKTKLCKLLDTPVPRGNDWRMLAQRLSVDRYINYFATKASPTEGILNMWEARRKDDAALTDLMNSLRVMGRVDATTLLEQELESWI